MSLTNFYDTKGLIVACCSFLWGMRVPLMILFLLLPAMLLSQEDRVLLSGLVRNDSLPIENAHIINKTSRKGSISGKNGEFQISAKAQDTLIISEIQYGGVIRIVTKAEYKSGKITVVMQAQDQELEEVIVQQYGNMAEELGLPNAGKTPLKKIDRQLNAYSQKSVPMVVLQALLFKPGGIDDLYNVISGNEAI